ncbi:ribosome-assembly protein 3-domain-containing protein [Stachybotrys elegans]|uniref:Ribosome assembly protein 3 n=1 Tax=Stachybotrys elegans TaxID=80388 RepID=A0A8K0T1F7_9HYPO|nr:ribosome-assembly protein 3-domain-containing protein [Stachybotrys elegans]
MPQPAGKAVVDPDFSSYYLQRTTQELADDLEKVRTAEDFKADSVSFLVEALQQGAGQFSAQDQKRVVAAVEKETKRKQG